MTTVTILRNGIPVEVDSESVHPLPTLERAKDDRKASIANSRYDAEVGGTTINGMPVATDRETQSKLIAARIVAKEDGAYTINWKGPDGFVVLDAATIIAVADGARQHVQACFDKEAGLVDQIDAATDIATVESISW